MSFRRLLISVFKATIFFALLLTTIPLSARMIELEDTTLFDGSAVFTQNVGFGIINSSAQIHVLPSTPTAKGLILQQSSGQSANLMECQDNTGVSLWNLSSSCNLSSTGSQSVSSSTVTNTFYLPYISTTAVVYSGPAGLITGDVPNFSWDYGANKRLTVNNIAIKGPFADVRAFGADSTGATDSLTAINSAISSLSSTCGTVLFPNGTYKFSGTITVPSCPNQQGIILYADPSTIYNTPTNADGIIFNGSWSSGMIGGQLLPGGSLTGTSTGKAVTFKGVHQQVIVHRVKFGGNQPNVWNYPVGLSLQTVYGALIDFNTFSSTTSIELLPTGLGDSVSTDLMISNNRLASASGGYVLYSAAGNTGNTSSTMWHNYIEGAKGYGVLIGTGTQGTGWRLIGEYYNNNTGPWDVSVNANNTSIIGCTFNSGSGPRTIIQATTTTTIGLVIQDNFLDGGNQSNVTGITLNNTNGSVGNNFFNHWTPGTPISPVPSYAIGPNWFDSAPNTFAINISTPTGDYNGVSASKNLVFGYNSSNTNVANDVGMVIRNQNTTNGITAGLHFARASGSSGSNDYPIGASIVSTFGPAVSNQYSTATIHFLLSQTANTAPAEVMTLFPNGNLSVLNLTASQFVKTDASKNFVSSLLQASDIPSGSNNYIQNQSSLQSGAVFNVSSGTVAGQLTVIGSTSNKFSLLMGTAPVSSSSFHLSVSTASGHVIYGGPVPAVSSCGVSPTLNIGSVDQSGTINVGTGVTLSCTLTFANSFGNTPNCTVSDNSTAVSAGINSISATSVVFGFSASLGGGQVYYNCPCSGTGCL